MVSFKDIFSNLLLVSVMIVRSAGLPKKEFCTQPDPEPELLMSSAYLEVYKLIMVTTSMNHVLMIQL